MCAGLVFAVKMRARWEHPRSVVRRQVGVAGLTPPRKKSRVSSASKEPNSRIAFLPLFAACKSAPFWASVAVSCVCRHVCRPFSGEECALATNGRHSFV